MVVDKRGFPMIQVIKMMRESKMFYNDIYE